MKPGIDAVLEDASRRNLERAHLCYPDLAAEADAVSAYRVGLLGEGIRGSLTPPMHEAEAAELGLDYRYDIFDLLESGDDPLRAPELLERARDDGYAALNVTHPCKQLIIPRLDELSPEAARLEAVNLVIFRDGRMIGHNTDWTGFRSAIDDGLPDVDVGTVVQIGAGGAGAATAYALLSLGVRRLVLADSDPTRASAVAHKYGKWFPEQVIDVPRPESMRLELAASDGVVNATPMGMAQHPGVSFDVRGLRPESWVADIVYLPIETELLRTARAAGHRVLDGGRMAVGQAADSLRLITGLEPDRDRMRAHFLAMLDRRVGRQEIV